MRVGGWGAESVGAATTLRARVVGCIALVGLVLSRVSLPQLPWQCWSGDDAKPCWASVLASLPTLAPPSYAAAAAAAAALQLL